MSFPPTPKRGYSSDSEVNATRYSKAALNMEAKRKAAFDKRRSELVEAWEQESAKRELEEDDIQGFEDEQRHPSATGRSLPRPRMRRLGDCAAAPVRAT